MTRGQAGLLCFFGRQNRGAIWQRSKRALARVNVLYAPAIGVATYSPLQEQPKHSIRGQRFSSRICSGDQELFWGRFRLKWYLKAREIGLKGDWDSESMTYVHFWTRILSIYVLVKQWSFKVNRVV